MAYLHGGLIEAVDYNGFRDGVINIYGVGFGTAGYGQSDISLPLVGVGDLIRSVEWTNLQKAITVCGKHQRQANVAQIPSLGDLEIGDVIQAHVDPAPLGSFIVASDKIIADKNLAHTSSMLYQNWFSKARSAWGKSSATYSFDADFVSGNTARYFFNSGGDLRIGTTRTGGAGTDEDKTWTDFLNSIGYIRMRRWNTLDKDGNESKPIGYYNLTASWQTIYSKSDTQSGTRVGWTPYRGGGFSGANTWRNPVNSKGEGTGPNNNEWNFMWIKWDGATLYQGSNAFSNDSVAESAYEIYLSSVDAYFQRTPGADIADADGTFDPTNLNNNQNARLAQHAAYGSHRRTTNSPHMTWEEEGVDCKAIVNPPPCKNGWWRLRRGDPVTFNITVNYQIQARRVGDTTNGANGNTTKFRVLMSQTGGANTPSGTTTVDINQYKASSPLKINSPTPKNVGWS